MSTNNLAPEEGIRILSDFFTLLETMHRRMETRDADPTSSWISDYLNLVGGAGMEGILDPFSEASRRRPPPPPPPPSSSSSSSARSSRGGTPFPQWRHQNRNASTQNRTAPSQVPFRDLTSPNPYFVRPTPPRTGCHTTRNVPVRETIPRFPAPNAISDTPKQSPPASTSSKVTLDENVAQFLAPNVESLREAEKYRVDQQLRELPLTSDVLQACTKFVRSYPIYPALIAVAFSHASLCLADHSVLEQLTDTLRKLAKGMITKMSWLVNHLEVKTRIVEAISIKPKDEHCKHSCLLARICDWRMITQTDIICLGAQVAVILQDRNEAQMFLQQREQNAQTLLDLLQALLGFSNIDKNMQRMFLYALIKLATKSGRLPQCLSLRNLTWQCKPFASGGFGDIYRGTVKSRTDFPLAIKVIRVYQRSQKDMLLKSFSSEAVVWSHLRHPNVLPFYGVFQQDEDMLCLVSPYMERGNIRDYLRRHPREANREHLALDIARGLEYLHSHSPTIIHTDIKGVNILVSKSGRACLADFGFATAKDTHQAHVRSTMPSAFTVAWAAPEIIDTIGRAGHQVYTTMSDMYAFGCVCYEIFCDKDPFQGVHSMVSIIHQVTVEGRRPARPERGQAPYLREDIWQLMSRCWLKVPTKRPSARDAMVFFQRRCTSRDAAGGGDSVRPENEWDYSILEEILAETEHPFSMFSCADEPTREAVDVTSGDGENAAERGKKATEGEGGAVSDGKTTVGVDIADVEEDTLEDGWPTLDDLETLLDDGENPLNESTGVTDEEGTVSGKETNVNYEGATTKVAGSASSIVHSSLAHTSTGQQLYSPVYVTATH